MIAVDEIREHVRPGWLIMDGVTVKERDDALDVPLTDVELKLRTSDAHEDRTKAVRAMFRRFGVDPTKTRPSSEALLRRIKKDEPLPRINSVVDICNWCSVEFQIPYGLYDLEKIQGPVAMRTGREGESYAGIRKDDVRVEGRLVVADEIGPFGNPTSDSARTQVTLGTTSVLIVLFSPASVPETDLKKMLDETSRRMREYAGGVERERGGLSASGG